MPKSPPLMPALRIRASTRSLVSPRKLLMRVCATSSAAVDLAKLPEVEVAHCKRDGEGTIVESGFPVTAQVNASEG